MQEYPAAGTERINMARKRDSQTATGVCQACGYRTATLSSSICPECGSAIVPYREPRAPKRRKIGWLSIPSMLYRRAYKWFIMASALDIVLTWLILQLGGEEVNALADTVIKYAGLNGMVIYKFCLMVFVVILCEVVGRRRPRLGRNLARASVVITAMPVVFSIVQLFA